MTFQASFHVAPKETCPGFLIQLVVATGVCERHSVTCVTSKQAIPHQNINKPSRCAILKVRHFCKKQSIV